MAESGEISPVDAGSDAQIGHHGSDQKPSTSVAYNEAASTFIRPQMRKLHDRAVLFEEYRYYAKMTRAEEAAHGSDSAHETSWMRILFPSKSGRSAVRESPGNQGYGEKSEAARRTNWTDHDTRAAVSDEEWANASRALRTAVWSSIFYLITTDILGPFAVGYSIGTTGWGPGIALYTVFGFLAGYSGFLIWKMFIGLDSYQFPLRTYGDAAFRIYGSWARHGLNFLQSIQLLCNVGVLIVGNGQALSEVSKFRLCYVVCLVIVMVFGLVVGQIRTLQKFGWLANAAVWLNITLIFLSMGVFAHSEPFYLVAQSNSSGASTIKALVTPDEHGKYPPVTHFAGLPDPENFVGAVTGLLQGVYAYGGAMLFFEFMAEMRRPADFLKAMFAAQTFIYVVYMLYGLFQYGYQGQYCVNPAFQGISTYSWQTVGNVIGIVSTMIAAALYGNIGVKVIYTNILVEWFNAPPLTSERGKWVWLFCTPFYWIIAFIVAGAIPNFTGLTSVVAAFCILQFTYTFPPILFVGYNCQRLAMKADAAAAAAVAHSKGNTYDPTTGTVTRRNSGVSRYIKAFFGGGPRNVAWNVCNVIYFLGALCTAGLGAYSAIELLISAFKIPSVNAFTCTSPLNYYNQQTNN